MPLMSKSNRPYNTPRVDDKMKLQQKIGDKDIRLSNDQKLKLPQSIITNEDFLDFTQDINSFGIFENLKPYGENIDFPCILIEANVAWIDKDMKGVYRYFTKTKKAKNAIGYTVMDLLQVLNDEEITNKRSFLLARRQLAYLTGAKYNQFVWEINQIMKYKNNIELLEFIHDINPNDKYMENHYRILRMFNLRGLYYLSTKDNSIKNEAILFISLDNIAKKLSLDIQKVSGLINQLVDKGFLNKISIDHEQVPKTIQKKIMQADFPHVNTLFSIPSYNEKSILQIEIPF